MGEWLFDLPIIWMAVVIFAATAIITYGIHFVVSRLATGRRAGSFKAVSGGMLPPLGIVFGLFVVFVSAQVWGDIDKATTAVNREASALSTVVFLSASFPGEPETELRGFVKQYIQQTVADEWPMMAKRAASLSITPTALAGAMQLDLSLIPNSTGQTTAQHEIAVALETALDARRQRIVVSESHVNIVKWACLFAQAIATLVAIAMVHSENRQTSKIALGIFATGIAVALFLIASHDRPFGGQIAVGPGPLLQVLPEEAVSRAEFDHSIALRLAAVLRSGRSVISELQDKINARGSDKGLTADTVIQAIRADYANDMGQPVPDLDPTSLEGRLLKAELQAIRDVMDRTQPLINDPQRGFKGFIPAVFTHLVAEDFNRQIGDLAYLKLTAPSELIRNPSDSPDAWEVRTIEGKFRSPTWNHGSFVAEATELGGRKAFRLMVPEYYEPSCLACHGEPKGDLDITGGKKEGGKLGDLGGAISVGIYLQ